MNIETSLSILHLFVGLIQFTAATFAFLSNRKSLINQIITGLLVLLGLTSVGVGFMMNAFNPGQALLWVIVEVFSVYAFAVTLFLVSFIIFIPRLGNNTVFRAVGVALVALPLFLMILDLFNVGTSLLGRAFVIDVSRFYTIYTHGYIPVNLVSTGILNSVMFYLRTVSYMIMAIYPLFFVVALDRQRNQFEKVQAGILLAATVLASIVSFLPENLLPTTLPALIANLIFAAALIVIALRNSELTSAQGRAFDFFQNLPMFNKQMINVIGIVLPSVLFISFSVYSFLSQNLVSASSTTLYEFAVSQERSISEQLDEFLHNASHTAADEAVLALVEERNQVYQNMSPEQVDAQLASIGPSARFIDLAPEELNAYPGLETLIGSDQAVQTLDIIDINGGLLAAVSEPDIFEYSSADWWESLISEQVPYLGTPRWNEQIDMYSMVIAAPILDDTGQFIGAIRMDYSLTPMLSLLQSIAAVGPNLAINVNNNLLRTTADQPESTLQLPNIAASGLSGPSSWNFVRFEEQNYLIVSAPLQLEEFPQTLHWSISAYEPIDHALGTLFFARNVLAVVSLTILLLSALASILLSRSISQPLTSLTNAAKQVLAGDLEVDIDLAGQDELGTLATTFRQMTRQLSGMVNTLESTIENRTADLARRTLQMETSAKVARQAAEIRDLQTLLDESVRLISDQFGFYHAGIFLIDSTGRYAVLQSASSPGGQRMLSRGHRLQVGKVGVVGYCAGTGLPRISQDVGADIVYYDNPDMPNTRSELALPLRVRNAIIGVLDVQSTEASAFAKEDIDILQTLADQIALAIDNVRLLQSSQRSLDELQRLYGQQAGQAWRQKLAGDNIAFQFTPTGIMKSDPKAASLENKPGHKISKEIKFRGQNIGNLNLLRDFDAGGWSEDEQALIDEILEQTALALENARLVDQIRLRSDQIQLLQEVSAISSEVLDEERLIPILAQKLQSSLDIQYCGVNILSGKMATLIEGVGDLENKPQAGTSLNIEREPITQRLVRTKEVDIFLNLQSDARAQSFVQAFATPEVNTLIFLPIVVRDQTVGYFFLADVKAEREIDTDEMNLFNQLSTLISTALENIRLFQETANRAERERQVAEITAKIRSSNDPQEIIQMAVAELKKALNPHDDGEPEESSSMAEPVTADHGKESI